MSTENIQSENPLVKQEIAEERKTLFTLMDFVRIITCVVLSVFLVVSSTMIPKTFHYEPAVTSTTNPAQQYQSSEPINQMGGIFQAGIEEYEYEEVLTTVRYQPAETIFIGGPRVEALGKNVLTDTQFLTTDIDDAKWIKEEAEFVLEETNDKKLCIVSVGLQNLDSAMLYTQTLNSWTDAFPEISFVFVNLGPVDESLYSNATNAKIQNFNNSMKSLLNDKWRYIDLYSYLAENGIEAEDGVNYSEELNTTLFSWILQQADTEEKIEYVPIIPEGSSD